MDVCKKVQKLVEALAQRLIKLEADTRLQAVDILELTDNLGKTRAEVGVLQKSAKQLEAENAKLKDQLQRLVSQKETKGGAGVGNDVKNLMINELRGKGKKALAVFPEEIWSMVFGRLKEPEDLKSCSNVCVKFQQMLESRRTIFLFDDVAKIIHGPAVQGYGDMEPYSYRRTPILPLMKCRRVCQAWKKSADPLILQECPVLPYYLPFNRDSNGNGVLFSHSKNPWQNPEIRNLPVDRNPMVSHYLVYNSDRPPHSAAGELKNYQYAFTAFLKKFGHHIWYFKADFGGDEPLWFPQLCSYMALMPNLKGLYLKRYDNKNEHYKKFRDGLDKGTFPLVPTMTVLHLEKCLASVEQSILKVNPQIERFKIDASHASQYTLHKLSELWVGGSWRLLESLNGPNLTKLTLKTGENWSDVFAALEQRFGDTLKELHLSLGGGADRSSGARLNLPNLEILGLRINYCFNSIDFILPLTGMKFLKVDLHEMYVNWDKYEKIIDTGYIPIGKIKETVKFHQYTHDLKNSNIWQLLPNLKKVMARTDRGNGFDQYGGGVAPRYDPVTPNVDYEWQYCTRGDVGT